MILYVKTLLKEWEKFIHLNLMSDLMRRRDTENIGKRGRYVLTQKKKEKKNVVS